MKNTECSTGKLAADYFDNGWVDLDEIIRVIAGRDKISASLPAELPERRGGSIEETRQKILALMELIECSEIAKDTIRKGIFTEEQIEELYKIWAEEFQKITSYLPTNEKSNSAGKQWRDFSVYRNGTRPRGVRSTVYK